MEGDADMWLDVLREEDLAGLGGAEQDEHERSSEEMTWSESATSSGASDGAESSSAGMGSPLAMPQRLCSLGDMSTGGLLFGDLDMEITAHLLDESEAMPAVVGGVAAATAAGAACDAAQDSRQRKRERDSDSSSYYSDESTSASTTSDQSYVPVTKATGSSTRRASTSTSTSTSAASGSASAPKRKRRPPTKPAPLPPGLTPAEQRQLKQKQKKERNRKLAAESRERRKHRLEDLVVENRQLKIRVQQLEDELAQRPEASVTCPKAAATAAPHGVTMKGTKLGTAAMALTMSMVVFTDTSQAEDGAASSFEMIGMWALAFDMLNDTGLFLDLLLPHMFAFVFGTTLTAAIISLFYARLFRYKSNRRLFELPTRVPDLRRAAASAAYTSKTNKSTLSSRTGLRSFTFQ